MCELKDDLKFDTLDFLHLGNKSAVNDYRRNFSGRTEWMADQRSCRPVGNHGCVGIKRNDHTERQGVFI